MPESWAGQYVGLPFKKNGTSPETGIDCWNLVRLVLVEQRQIMLPEQGGPVEGWTLCQDTPKAFDVVVMGAVVGRGSPSPPHVGIMLDAERMLHIDEGRTSHILPLHHPFVRVRSFDIYRHVSATL